MINANEFGVLLKEGIASAARKQRVSKREIEQRLANKTGYGSHMVVHWQRGKDLPSTRESIEEALLYCVKNGRVGRQWAEALLRSANYSALEGWSLLNLIFDPDIFICYQVNAQRDHALAAQLAQKLSGCSHIFFDQEAHMTIAQSETVQQKLQAAHFFIVLLSPDSVNSDTIHRQLKKAYIQAQSRLFPIIVPIFVGDNADFLRDLPLLASIDMSLGVRWNDAADTESVVAWIKHIIDHSRPQHHATFPPSRHIPLELPSSPITQASHFYIERPSDMIALDAIRRSKVTLTIKGPRQMGKTSLLAQLIRAAKQSGKQVVHLDFELLQPFTGAADTFYRAFCQSISNKLNLPDRTEPFWQKDRTNPDRTEQYMSLILRDLNSLSNNSLLLAIDNAEAIFGASFQTDFFGMLRYWHNKRATSMSWRKIDLALVTSTEPYFFIENLNQSPFNVGEIIELHPFTLEQTADLNLLHSNPLTADQTAQLHQLLNGHPYLTRRLLYAIATKQTTFDHAITHATSPNGLFYDSLRLLIQMMEMRDKTILALLQTVVKNGSVARRHVDNPTYFALNGLGIVRLQDGRIQFANQLYARFFGEWFDAK